MHPAPSCALVAGSHVRHVSDCICCMPQLSKPEGKGKAYEAALGGGGGIPALETTLRTLGASETPALELEDFEVAGKQRVMVLDVTRARLVT